VPPRRFFPQIVDEVAGTSTIVSFVVAGSLVSPAKLDLLRSAHQQP
jgi:hypothetical protein